MRVYLVRHGESLEKSVNGERPLSEKGKKDIEKMASEISGCPISVDKIFHSGILRAKQTAEILGKHNGFNFQGEIKFKQGLEPNDPVDTIAYELNQENQDTVLVGHLPFMSKLVSKLIVQDENKPIVSYQPGSIVCLERTREGIWVIVWMLPPLES